MRYIGIIILLVLCIALLLLTGYIVNTEKLETENPQKWSGLTGFTAWYSNVACATDTWLANGFTEIRFISSYQDITDLNSSKAAVIAGNTKGLKFIWGVGAQSITAENWPTFRQAILDAAQWAQDNGVYEFQIGNEEELHNDNTTLTDAQLRTNLKSVATDVQAIFTRGNISYSCAQNSVGSWITIGRGDIDILAANEYMGETTFDNNVWKTDITNLVNAFGPDGTYLTEFSLSSVSLDTYSTDEAVQAAGITEMIEYIKASGIERALFYSWKGDEFGVVKDDGTYRLLWNQALLNTGLVESTTVPTKTTTISLPDTIALIPK